MHMEFEELPCLFERCTNHDHRSKQSIQNSLLNIESVHANLYVRKLRADGFKHFDNDKTGTVMISLYLFLLNFF